MSLDPKVRMLNLIKTVKRSERIEPKEDFNAWHERALARLNGLLGLPLERCSPDFRIEFIDKENPEFDEIRFLFRSEPDVDVAAHLLTPKNIREDKIPLVICLQGHSTGMHISLGRAKFPGDEAVMNGGDRNFALQIVRRGQAALAIDQRAFGERGGTEKGPACHQPTMQALLLGQTIVGQRCWDVSRAIDVVAEEFPQIDTDRIAVMGNSGGGTTALFAPAVDERIAAAMPSCYFCGFADSIGALYHCECNYVPGIINYFDMGDIAGLIAPRPLIIVSGQKDNIFPIASAKEQFEIAKVYYERAGVPQNIRHVIGPEGHRFYADLSWPVFDELTGWNK